MDQPLEKSLNRSRIKVHILMHNKFVFFPILFSGLGGKPKLFRGKKSLSEEKFGFSEESFLEGKNHSSLISHGRGEIPPNSDDFWPILGIPRHRIRSP